MITTSNMRSLIIGFMLLLTIISAVPLPAQAFSIVPCGRSDQVGTVNENCTLRHLFFVITRLINYLVSVAALVAIYQIISAGFGIVTALGNAESIAFHKTGLRNAVVGFAIVVLSFMLVNLLINGIFGNPSSTRPWWDVNCIYDITNASGCPI